MSMAVITNLANPSEGRLRPFDIRRDLNGVADLVELCFADTLDRDGQRYLRQMRDAARNTNFLHWATTVVEQPSLPLSGYVWEEDGRLVGNLSLVPFFVRGHRAYLIANVATHPDYRRRGIARSLTSRALEHAQAYHASAAWLHVRDDNDAAIRLYLSLGFQERARRTTWHSLPSGHEAFPAPFLPYANRVVVRSGGLRDWPLERDWIRQIYPPEIVWHLPLNLKALQPNLWGSLNRVFSGIQVRHWVALQGAATLAALAWQNLNSYADALWLAAPKNTAGPAITSLLALARQDLSPLRSLTLDFPAGWFAPEIRAAGFQAHNTLIWMEAPLPVARSLQK
jgi:ribosomal protein S18 acetylase RimI-like enzyme